MLIGGPVTPLLIVSLTPSVGWQATLASVALPVIAPASLTLRRLSNIIGDRNVLLLAFSYLNVNYSFYLFDLLVLFVPGSGVIFRASRAASSRWCHIEDRHRWRSWQNSVMLCSPFSNCSISRCRVCGRKRRCRERFCIGSGAWESIVVMEQVRRWKSCLAIYQRPSSSPIQ